MNILNFIVRLYKQYENFGLMCVAEDEGETSVVLKNIDETAFKYMGIKYKKMFCNYDVSLGSTTFIEPKTKFTFDGITADFCEFPAEIRQSAKFQIENDRTYILRYTFDEGGTIYTDTFPLTDDPVLIQYNGSHESKVRLIIYLYKWLLDRTYKIPVEVCLVLHRDARENVDKSEWIIDCMDNDFIEL